MDYAAGERTVHKRPGGLFIGPREELRRMDETAYKATIQSASLVDLATATGGADVAQVEVRRELLRRIAAMLIALSKVAAHA
jgi:hypothetical protein